MIPEAGFRSLQGPGSCFGQVSEGPGQDFQEAYDHILGTLLVNGNLSCNIDPLTGIFNGSVNSIMGYSGRCVVDSLS